MPPAMFIAILYRTDNLIVLVAYSTAIRIGVDWNTPSVS